MHDASAPLQGAARDPTAKKASKPAGSTSHPNPEAEKFLNEPKGDFMTMVGWYGRFPGGDAEAKGCAGEGGSLEEEGGPMKGSHGRRGRDT